MPFVEDDKGNVTHDVGNPRTKHRHESRNGRGTSNRSDLAVIATTKSCRLAQPESQ
jgi:hypothetical protein